MEWKRAIITVLAGSPEARHYTDIADEIIAKRYRSSNELGATPANTVAVVIGSSLREEGEDSPFVRVTRGFYSLRGSPQQVATAEEISGSAISPSSGIINALGMFWDRLKVVWSGHEPKILGKQQQASTSVDFCKQVGVYFLHDNQGVVYVGRVTDGNLGKRLHHHTVDRLSGRWDRFSWFGIYPVQGDGSLQTGVDFSNLGPDVVVSTLEAVLIEGLEPRQNRRRGDDFQAIEYLQVKDPRIGAV